MTQMRSFFRSWAPFAAAFGFLAFAWLRTGVELGEVARYSSYWILGITLPGTLVFRVCCGTRRRLPEDLTFGTVTGFGLELVAWCLAAALGVPGLVRVWWLLVTLVITAVPSLRKRALVRCTDTASTAWAWAMAAVSALVVVQFDLFWFRTAPLPPETGAIYHDMWWHLSLAQEFARVAAPEIPQLVGEPLRYHFFAHLHMGVATRSSGVAADVVVFRLAMLPLSITAIFGVAALTRQLTGSAWSGVAAAWFSFGAVITTYFWPGITLVAATALHALSPTQIMALPYIVVIGWGVVTLIHGGFDRRGLTWLAFIIAASSAVKPAVLPVVIAGLGLAFVVRWWQEGRPAGSLMGLIGVGVACQLGILAFAHGGGDIAIPRLAADVTPFKDVVQERVERADNEGLLLSTIDSPWMLFLAVLSLVVFVGTHAVWVAGAGSLAAASQRRDPAMWFLAGVLGSGLVLTAVIDHVAFAQSYFWKTVAPIGASLTVVAFHRLAKQARGSTPITQIFAIGAGVGVAVAAAVDALMSEVGKSADFGAVDRAALPLVLAAAISLTLVLAWRRLVPGRPLEGAGGAIALAAVLGVGLPTAFATNIAHVERAVDRVAYPDATADGNLLLAGEAEALIWVRDNTPPGDVVVSNAWCRPMTRVPRDPPCPNQGFWLTGLTGRRAVIDGYAYTTDALEAHMTDGLTFRNVVLFDDRIDPVIDLMGNASASALDELQREYDLAWIVVLNRSGVEAVDLDEIAERVFGNDDAVVYRVR